MVKEVLQRRQEPWRVQWLAIRSWQRPIEKVIEADPLTITWEVPEEVNVNHSIVVQHLKQIGKVEKLDKRVPHVLVEKKKSLFWSIIFSYSTQQQQTISQLDCDVQWKGDSIGQPAMTSSVFGPRRSFKALPKDKRAPKNGHGHCLVVCCPADLLSSFLNPRKTIASETYALQIDEMHWQLQHLQLALVNRKAQFFST